AKLVHKKCLNELTKERTFFPTIFIYPSDTKIFDLKIQQPEVKKAEKKYEESELRWVLKNKRTGLKEEVYLKHLVQKGFDYKTIVSNYECDPTVKIFFEEFKDNLDIPYVLPLQLTKITELDKPNSINKSFDVAYESINDGKDNPFVNPVNNKSTKPSRLETIYTNLHSTKLPVNTFALNQYDTEEDYLF
ncbi:MAG: hypothetical protein JHC93_08820, partial [Parachlamydiales bacterium]|nr:hypothetical protein [Parachlamydiales bacterium]